MVMMMMVMIVVLWLWDDSDELTDKIFYSSHLHLSMFHNLSWSLIESLDLLLQNRLSE